MYAPRCSETVANFKSLVVALHQSEQCDEEPAAVDAFEDLVTDVRMLPLVTMGKGFLTAIGHMLSQTNVDDNN